MSTKSKPPKLLEQLLETILPKYVDETSLGDFEEEYISISTERGVKYANIWYSCQIIKSIPFFILDSIRWAGVLFKNYLKITLRDINRNKSVSFIKIIGLSVGMACCVVIMLFVKEELSFDRFHEKAERIYRITSRIQYQGKEPTLSSTHVKVGPLLKIEWPEVVDAARIVIHRGYVIEYEEKRLSTNPIYADPNILNIFTFPLLRGDKSTALSDPNNVVISKALATKLFGKKDPMGKTILIYTIHGKYDLKITGIMKNIPDNSHLKFDFLAPVTHLENRWKDEPNMQLRSCVNYLLLNNYANPLALEKRFPDFLKKHFSERYASSRNYSLQPLTSIHLYSDSDFEVDKHSSISFSYYLSAIALLILFIACINYVNLSTARASRRSREVGVRKVVGATRKTLLKQFIGESIILSLLALLLAILLSYFLLSIFNSLMSRQLAMNFENDLYLYLGLLLLCIGVGTIAGLYPALFTSSFNPVKVLKGEIIKGKKLGILTRKGLVIFQFIITVIFIFGTITIFKQLNYVRNKNLGFERDHVINIPIFKDQELTTRADLIKNELGQHPNIRKIIISHGCPGVFNGFPAQCVPEGFPEDKPFEMAWFKTGEDFFNFFSIEIVEGRDFSKEVVSDAASAVIINEKAARLLGWESPIGKLLKSKDLVGIDEQNNTGEFQIIGVVKDFHNGPLYEEIKPSIYLFDVIHHWEIYIRIRPYDIDETISFLREKWRSLPTHLIFNYYFLDDSLDILYERDRKAGKVFTFSAIIAGFLACLGLFGLISYATERRVKEIGIRKVLGASVSRLLILLSKDFLILFIIANSIAFPLAYYLMSQWLQNFSSRISIGLWIFLSSSIVALLITLFTMSFQTVKAATSNPADILRYE